MACRIGLEPSQSLGQPLGVCLWRVLKKVGRVAADQLSQGGRLGCQRGAWRAAGREQPACSVSANARRQQKLQPGVQVVRLGHRMRFGRVCELPARSRLGLGETVAGGHRLLDLEHQGVGDPVEDAEDEEQAVTLVG